MDLRAVIMAGGTGTRFWPLSRRKRPKQFLPITSHKTMIEDTVGRLYPLLKPGEIYTIANRELTEILRGYLPDAPAGNLLIEPEARNTAPCLMLATAALYLENPEAVLAVLPADHAIRDADKFRERLRAGAEAAAADDRLITFGIPPAFPATGYGYIRFSRTSPQVFGGGASFYAVQEFKENPDSASAQEFCDAGNYFWNSGMFLWQARVFARQIERYAPELHAHWEAMLEAVRRENRAGIAAVYQRLPATSIDYALMEKSQGVLMGEGDFGWSDVGAWSALSEFWPRDGDGNAVRGESLAIGSRNCLAYSSPGKLTALIGVQDLIVVETEDALLICRKDQDQKVKDLVAELRKAGKDELL
jgi:mannose-1-phosphate guanylyltransferase